MIRILALVVAGAVATAAAAQITESALLSPVPMTAEGWGSRGAKVARVAQEPAAPVPLPALREPAEQSAPALKRAATVTGEIVRIGDLVENAGAVGDVPIFRAPDPGQTGSVKAARVLEAVRPHHIIRLDTRGLDEVAVTRASRTVTVKEIEARLLRALAGQGGLDDTRDLGASFDHDVRPFHVEPNAEFGIARLSYDQRSRRFDVVLDLPGNAARRPVLRLTGKLIETAEAVVPLRAIAQGATIKASDVMIERRPKSDAVAIEDVLGFVAKRALKPGQVIRAADVMKPEVVARNETVTISYEVPGMVLSTRGKALEAGTLGDVINVLNIQSKRTLQGTVSGPGRVVITATPPRLAANVVANPANPRR